MILQINNKIITRFGILLTKRYASNTYSPVHGSGVACIVGICRQLKDQRACHKHGCGTRENSGYQIDRKEMGIDHLAKSQGRGSGPWCSQDLSVLFTQEFIRYGLLSRQAHETEVPGRLAVSDAASCVIGMSWDAKSPVLGILVWMILHAVQTETIKVALNLPSCVLHHAFPRARACATSLYWPHLDLAEVFQSIKNITNTILVYVAVQRLDTDYMQFSHVGENVLRCTATASMIDSHIHIFEK